MSSSCLDHIAPLSTISQAPTRALAPPVAPTTRRASLKAKPVDKYPPLHLRIINGGLPSLIKRTTRPSDQAAPAPPAKADAKDTPGDCAANPLVVVDSPVKKRKYRLFMSEEPEDADPWVVLCSPPPSPFNPEKEQVRMRAQRQMMRRARKDLEAAEEGAAHAAARALRPRAPKPLGATRLVRRRKNPAAIGDSSD
ncbi:hypothetical protein C8F04DRAFT_1260477 [Mycena alexandri]|uniref:Uncharacterized protein n=1 Tax=Mycena alexandri TaxID=1745969 RepID=A0AAD6X3X8_9AGAR|nr:hypothetical protein C8F04DRAFT_1260477 [Mycena alexandri]